MKNVPKYKVVADVGDNFGFEGPGIETTWVKGVNFPDPIAELLNIAYNEGQESIHVEMINVFEVKEILRDAIWGNNNRPKQTNLNRFLSKYGGL